MTGCRVISQSLNIHYTNILFLVFLSYNPTLRKKSLIQSIALTQCIIHVGMQGFYSQSFLYLTTLDVMCNTNDVGSYTSYIISSDATQQKEGIK